MKQAKKKGTRKIRHFFIFAEVWYSFFLIFVELLRVLNPYWLPSVVLSTFRFYLYIPALLLWIVFVIRRQFKRHIFLLVNVLCLLYFYGAQFIPKPQKRDETILTAMTFNIQNDMKGSDGIAALIREKQPGILALQEISVRSPVIPALKTLGYQVEHRPYYARSGMGLAIAVKKPVHILKVLRKTYHEKGQWSYLFAEIELPARSGHKSMRMNVILPHLLPFGLKGNPLKDLPDKLAHINNQTQWQIQETQALLLLVQSFHDPTLMLGDFNSTPEQKLHSEIRKYMKDAWLEKGFGYGGTRTYGVPLRIDYIYMTDHFQTTSVERGPASLSDHRPVMAYIK